MTDFTTDVELSRDDLVSMMQEDDEHVVYIITSVLNTDDIDDIIEQGELKSQREFSTTKPERNRERVITNLRRLANAIEDGSIK